MNAPSVTLILKIFENALTIGLVTSLANPHRAKHAVTIMNGMSRLTPFLVNNPLFFSMSSGFFYESCTKVQYFLEKKQDLSNKSKIYQLFPLTLPKKVAY